MANDIAARVDPRFPDMQRQIDEDENTASIIHECRELLDEGNNLWLFMPHVDDIRDVGFGPLIALNLLDADDEKRRPDRDKAYRPGEVFGIISKAMSACGYTLGEDGDTELVDIVSTLGILCDHVYLPWPKTTSSKSALATLPKSEVDRINQKVITAIYKIKKTGGAMGVVAPTGSTRVSVDKDGTYNLGSVNDGTADLIMGDYVLAMAMWLKGKVAYAKLCGRPIRIERREQIDGVLQTLASTMTDGVEGVKFAHNPPTRRRLGGAALSG